MTTATIWGREITVGVGSIIRPDQWKLANTLSSSDWDGAAFRLNTYNPVIASLAVNVTITGRTIRRVQGDSCVRVQIEFVGDGEPSTVCGGWLKIGY